MSYSSLSIGLFIFIMAFFISSPSFRDLAISIFTPELAPKQEMVKLPGSDELPASQFCQDVDPASAPTFKAPADNATKTDSEDDPALGTPIFNKDCKSDGPNHQFSPELTTYRLIRKNVPLTRTEVKNHKENFTDESCHFDTADELGIDIEEVDKSKYKVFFPQISGEISLDRLSPSRTRGGESNLMYFIDYGLVFLLHINPDGSLTELKGGTTQGQSETFVLADVYQDIETPGRDGLLPEALSCDTTRGAKIANGPQVIVPPQGTNPANDQLQLQYFVFGKSTGSSEVVNGWGIHCKPAIYLYPNQKQLVNVKVKTKGFLTYVDPPYDSQTGWTVEANPNGSLSPISYLVSRITYPYLYYESKLPRSLVKKPELGWVMKQSELPDFFVKTLPKLGLNQKETKDFTDYWTKTLNSHPYYFVGLLDQSLINYLEPLQIEPKPDSLNRVRLYFEGLDNPQQTTQPALPSIENFELKIKNSRFSVSEWGGVVDTGKDELFVCNQ